MHTISHLHNRHDYSIVMVKFNSLMIGKYTDKKCIESLWLISDEKD